MELKDFISSTILQISEGIADAQKKNNDILVNPAVTIGSNGDYSVPENPEAVNITRRVQLLNFDILVNVSEDSSVEGGGKVSILSINTGINGFSKESTSQSNRIQFTLPICLPCYDNK